MFPDLTLGLGLYFSYVRYSLSTCKELAQFCELSLFSVASLIDYKPGSEWQAIEICLCDVGTQLQTLVC